MIVEIRTKLQQCFKLELVRSKTYLTNIPTYLLIDLLQFQINKLLLQVHGNYFLFNTMIFFY